MRNLASSEDWKGPTNHAVRSSVRDGQDEMLEALARVCRALGSRKISTRGGLQGLFYYSARIAKQDLPTGQIGGTGDGAAFTNFSGMAISRLSGDGSDSIGGRKLVCSLLQNSFLDKRDPLQYLFKRGWLRSR